MQTPKIIAEIGCNHKGDMQIAKEMITTAAIFCKVDVIKFQKRTPKELLSPAEYDVPHQILRTPMVKLTASTGSFWNWTLININN